MSPDIVVLICAIAAALSLYTGWGTRPVKELAGLFWIALAGPEYWKAARYIRACQPDPERIAALELECNETTTENKGED